MNKPKMIILADIGSLRVTCNGFKQIVADLENRFEIVACKFYSYVAKRNRDFNEYISANGYETNLPSASRRRNKLDCRQVIDAANYAKNERIDAVGLITGEGDILPVIDMLKSVGKDVYDINVIESKYSDKYTAWIPVPASALREGYAAPASKPAAKKVPKEVPAKAAPAAAATEQAENPGVGNVRDILAKFKK